jgi:hypothetical protein
MPSIDHNDPFATVTSFFSSGLWSALSLLLEIFLVLLWLALIWWTYQDVRRRTENGVIITIAVVLAVVLPFFGPIIYLIIRPPEIMDEARERELELVALERRLHELGDDEGRQMVSRIIARDGLGMGGDIDAGDILHQAGAVTRDDLKDLESRLTELEFRLRVTDRVNREATTPGGPFDQTGETGQAQAIRQTRTDTPSSPGGFD